MDSWEKVFREGIAPLFTESELMTLRDALEKDDPDLIQGATTRPPPLQCVQDWPVEAACALGYLGWKGRGKETVGETEEEFTRACFEADQRLGEPAAVRWFLWWWDEQPREIIRKEMIRVLADLLDKGTGDAVSPADPGNVRGGGPPGLPPGYQEEVVRPQEA